MKTLTKPTQLALAVTITLLLGIGFQFVTAWTTPTALPPNDNVLPPITTGDWQTKTGGLFLNSLGTSPIGLAVLNGNVAIGTSIPPRAKLDVLGDIISSGSNAWLYHTPDDGRTSLYFGSSVNNAPFTWPIEIKSNGTIKANQYCNSDETKCLEFNDPVIGDPLYLKTVSWDIDYNAYNDALWVYINNLNISEASKQQHYDNCIPFEGQFSNTAYNSDPLHFNYCGNFACAMASNGEWPEMVTLSDMCSTGGGSDCNGSNFFISWDCMNVIH